LDRNKVERILKGEIEREGGKERERKRRRDREKERLDGI